MTPDVPALLAEWDALSEAASEGPWDNAGQGWVRHSELGVGSDEFPEVLAATVSHDADAAFIAAARTGWPAATAALRAVHKALPYRDLILAAEASSGPGYARELVKLYGAINAALNALTKEA